MCHQWSVQPMQCGKVPIAKFNHAEKASGDISWSKMSQESCLAQNHSYMWDKQQDGPHLEATNHIASVGPASRQMAHLQATCAIAFRDIFQQDHAHLPIPSIINRHQKVHANVTVTPKQIDSDSSDMQSFTIRSLEGSFCRSFRFERTIKGFIRIPVDSAESSTT